MINFARKTLCLAAFGLVSLTSSLSAQSAQIICFSFDGTSNSSSVDSTNGPSKTGVRIGGHDSVMLDLPAATTPTGAADKLLAALTAKGFTASKSNPTEVCVTTGPGGTALTKGGGIGTTDTGLKGINVGIMKLPNAPKKVKGKGVTIPKIKPAMAATVGGTIQVDVEVEKTVNGVKQIQHIQVQVPVQPGDTSFDIDQKVRQSLEGKGLRIRDVEIQDVFDQNRIIPCFALEMDLFGDPVLHVVYQYDIEPQLIEMQLTGGELPIVGAGNYGDASSINLPGQPLPFMDFQGQPYLGGFGCFKVENCQPFAPVAMIVGLQDMEVPFLFPGGFLLVNPDPFHLDFMGPANPLGGFGVQFPIPPDPRLAGFELHTQALTGSGSQFALTDGLRLKVGQ